MKIAYKNSIKQKHKFIYIIIIISFLISLSSLYDNYLTGGYFKVKLESLNEFKGVCQLFYDDGSGFSEKKSIKKIYEIDSAGQVDIFYKLNKGEYRGFRIDPVYGGEANIILKELAIIDINGEVVKEYFSEDLSIVNNVDSLTVHKDKYLSIFNMPTTHDPQLFFLNEQSFSLGNESRGLVSVFFARFFLVFLLVLSLYAIYRKLKSAIEHKNYSFIFFIILVPVIFLFLLLRNIDPLINPILYTEDASWLSLIINRGFVHALLNARPDYFVVINVLLQGLAFIINYAINNYNLIYLPHILSVISYLFYAICFALPMLLLRRQLSFSMCLVLVCLFCLIGFGNSSSEIFGKLSNIGYILAPLSVFLLFFSIRVK